MAAVLAKTPFKALISKRLENSPSYLVKFVHIRMVSASPAPSVSAAAPSARRAAHGLLRRLVKVLLLLVAFQTSGFVELARELGWFGDDIDCCDTCPNDEEGTRCPPNCPRCHCSNGRVAALPGGGEFTMSTVDLDPKRVPTPPDDTDAPRAPYAPSIYRPPRA